MTKNLLMAWFAMALLAGCATARDTAGEPDFLWNGGVWNSVLGYHGPANAVIVGGP